MALFGLIFLTVALILIGVGVAIGLVLTAVAAVAIVFGIVSSSVVYGLIQRRASSAFRALFYQACLLCFSCLGIAVTGIIAILFELQFSIVQVILIGILTGSIVGAIFGLLHSWLIERIATFLSPRQKDLPNQIVEATPVIGTLVGKL